ncbi:MAG: PAS domain S-box protein [Spirochaetes bacterium]|jgi:PAS domain S-box-containing protein|nr:PAS domain S-box protein [Spirochaetota bacterium]
MAEQTVHLVTADTRVVTDVREAAKQWDLPLAVVPYDNPDEAAGIGNLPESDVILVDADLVGPALEEMLDSCGAAHSIVVGTPGTEGELTQAHAHHRSEFLLKDEGGHYALLVASLVRKLLRDEDRDETTRDIIRSSEERYRSLVEALPDIIYRLDPNGYFTFVNGSVRALGYEPSALIGQHFSTIVDPDDLPRVSRRKVLRDFQGHATGPAAAPGLFDERRTADRRTTGLEIRIRRPKGSRKENETPMIASLISYGEITATGQYRTDTARRYFIGTVGIIRDISERKRSQERLRQLSFAIEQIDTAVCIAGAEGVVDYANPSFFRMNGARPEEVHGARLYDFFAGYVEEAKEGELKSALSATGTWGADRIIRTRSGESKWCWLRVYPVFDLEKQASQYLVFQDDIGDRKRRELELTDTAASHQEVLRMIHHRVGSTLRMLSEIEPSTSAAAAADEEAAGVESADTAIDRRIHAQILAHEIVYESGSFDRLDLARYFRALPDAVLSRMSRRGRLEVELEDCVIGLNTALPLAIAASECIAALWPPPAGHLRTIAIALERPQASGKRAEGANGPAGATPRTAGSAEGAALVIRYDLPAAGPKPDTPRPAGELQPAGKLQSAGKSHGAAMDSHARIIIESLLSQVDGELIVEDGIRRLTFREEPLF